MIPHNLGHSSIYVPRENAGPWFQKTHFLLIYSHFLTQDVNFESPQFKPIDHLKGVNGELILETDAIDYGDKISFYIKKSKLRMKSTFPKIMILSSFYEYDIPTHDLYTDHAPKNKESKVSIAVSEVHFKKIYM